MKYESILVIPVPAADPVVEECRLRHDPSAPRGMPAHITVNYPFQFPQNQYSEVVGVLTELFSSFSAFDFSLTSLGRFPGVLFLEPQPRSPFIELVQAVAARFTDSPPYGGRHESINPHLTLAQEDDEELIDDISDRFANCTKDQLPLKTIAEQI